MRVEGQSLVFMPEVHAKNDYRGINTAMVALGAHRSGSTGEYCIPLRNAAVLLEKGPSVHLCINSLESTPSRLRAAAIRFRRQADFMESVSGDVELYPYQTEGVGYLHQNPAALLFDDMGLGKTVQALMALEPVAPALVVCPAFIKGVWRDEAKLWRRDLEVTILDKFRWPEPGELCVINYARLPTTDALNKSGQPWPKTVTIFDEAHYLKNGKAQRTVKGRLVSKRARKVGGLTWLLTGTPLQNRPKELWALLVLLGRHKELYGSWTRFAHAFGGKKDVFGYTFDPEGVTDEAIQVLRAHAMRREKWEVLEDLPEKTYRTIRVPPPDDAELIASLDNVDHELLDMALDGDASLETVAHLSAARKELASYKAEKLEPFLAEYKTQGRPVLVFSAHVDAVQRIAKQRAWACIIGSTSVGDREDIVRNFQAGYLKGLAATIGAAGVGVTLTAASDVVFIDRAYNPSDNLQAEDRVCRIGQDRGVMVTDVVCDHPVDHAVASILRQKQELISATTGRLVEDKRPSMDRNKVAETLETLARLIEK